MLGRLADTVVGQKLKYAASEVAENGHSRYWRSWRVNARINAPIQQRVSGDAGIDVPAADWDTLIVVDGCRADLFEEAIDTARFDEYDTVTSKASATKEWCQKNWTGSHADTVYVTGNPVVSREIPGRVRELREVWRDHFDRDHNTILPGPVTEAALDAHESHPDKRLVVHYIQPHYPFVGYPDLHYATWGSTPEIESKETESYLHNVWAALCDGYRGHDEVWSAYRDNLEHVMADVWELVEALDGRTVVTSDHGNAVGERSAPVPVRTYGHPPELRLESLVDVPWAVVESGERRDVVEGEATTTGDATETDAIEEQLSALGYA